MTNDLDGRTALVTGGAGGIGRPACWRWPERGGQGARRRPRRAGRRSERRPRSAVWAHVVDLADAGAIDTLPEAIDILVNNAGSQHVAPLHEFPPRCFSLLQQVMVTAPFL
jgi:3-hydroxybutyrate dehydrogenase